MSIMDALRCALVLRLASGLQRWTPETELLSLHGESFYDSAPWDRVAAELERSVTTAYGPPMKSDSLASKTLRQIMRKTEELLFVYRNKLYVMADHASVRLSLSWSPRRARVASTPGSVGPQAQAALPLLDAAVDHGTASARELRCFLGRGRDGQRVRGVSVESAVPRDREARGLPWPRHPHPEPVSRPRCASCRDARAPRRYFAHVDEWDRRCAAWRAEAPPWDARKDRLFWRGAVRTQCGVGNVARLEALTLTAAHPELFDVRLASRLTAPDLSCADSLPYTEAMKALTTGNASSIVGDFVDAKDFARWKQYLNLPGTMGGSYSRNLNLLWTMRGVVHLWDGSAVEWYYPGLRTGETHETCSSLETAVAALARVRRVPGLEAKLRAGSDFVAETFLSGAGLENYWRLVVDKLRSHFRMAAVMKDGRWLGETVCEDLRRVEWQNTSKPFYDDTPGEGHPITYVELDEGDPAFALCQGGYMPAALANA